MELLNKHFGCVRLVFNLALEVKQEAYVKSRKNLSAFDLIKQIPDLKNELPFLKEVNAQSLQATVVNLETSFKNFFKHRAKYPNFKKKSSRQSFQVPQAAEINLKEGKLFIPKFREGIRTVFDREFTGVIKTTTITKTPTGKYFAAILVDNKKESPAKASIAASTTIGIDLGIKSFAVTSNGEVFDNPKFLRAEMVRLKILQRRASRKKKGSSNRRKSNLRVALLHEKISNQRKDFLQKLSTKLIRNNQTICLEDLSVSNMVKNHSLAQSISDCSWSEFVRMIQYKADWYGNNVIKIGRFEPSSKNCSDCGSKNELLTIADREWLCANCGTLHDRDLNAAKNIKAFGLKNSGEGISGESVELLALAGAKKQKKSFDSQSI
jgi:putative transposase